MTDLKEAIMELKPFDAEFGVTVNDEMASVHCNHCDSFADNNDWDAGKLEHESGCPVVKLRDILNT